MDCDMKPYHFSVQPACLYRKAHPLWEHMYKATSTGKSIILYTSNVNACIFPRADLKGNEVAVIEMISKYMPTNKVKIKA